MSSVHLTNPAQRRGCDKHPLSVESPWDQIIEQDDMMPTKFCCKCIYALPPFIDISCGHSVCTTCCDRLIGDEKCDKCPSCQAVLTNNLFRLFNNYMANPMSRLSHRYDIVIGNVIWVYQGGSHNWIYSKEHCDQIECAYQNFLEDDELNEEQITGMVSGNPKTYVIDFDSMVQYCKDTSDKPRYIGRFILNSKHDLVKHKVIGVAGELL